MSKNVLYCDFNDNDIEIIQNLQSKNWFPKVIISNGDKELNTFQNNFPETKIFFQENFRKGNYGCKKENGNNQNTCSIEELKAVSENLISFFLLAESASEHNFSYSQRLNLLYDGLHHFLNLIKNEDIHLVIFKYIPHHYSSFLIYLICKKILKINLLFIDGYTLLNDDIHLITNDIENVPKLVNDDYSKLITKVSDNANKYYNDILKKEKPKILQENIKYMKAGNTILSCIIKFLISIFSGSGFKKSRFYGKKNKREFGDEKGIMNNIEYNFFILKNIYKKKILKKYYNSLILNYTREDKYIFFSSSYQPEARTTILANYFSNQELALKNLIEFLPDGWLIYFKEHPSIFSEISNGRPYLTRSKNYYDRLIKLNKVKLISTKVNSFELIEKSKGVASCGGTASFEACVFNKPSISFGNTWYSKCNLIYNGFIKKNVKNFYNDCMSNIRNDNSTEILKYLTAIENSAYKIKINNSRILRSGLNKEEKLNISDAYMDAYYKIF